MAKQWNSTLNAPTKRMKRTPLKSRKQPMRKRGTSKVTDATSILRNTRQEVLVRDLGRCIICGSMNALQCHHYIYRKPHLGMGIKENLVMLCVHCHDRVHKHDKQNHLVTHIKKYLDKLYPDFKDEDRVYKKWTNIET